MEVILQFILIVSILYIILIWFNNKCEKYVTKNKLENKIKINSYFNIQDIINMIIIISIVILSSIISYLMINNINDIGTYI